MDWSWWRRRRYVAPKVRVHRLPTDDYAALPLLAPSYSLASASITAPIKAKDMDTRWQARGWDFYDTVPEMRLVTDYRSSALSKVIVRLGKYNPDGDIEPVEGALSDAVLGRLFGGQPCHGAALKRIAELLTITGEYHMLVLGPPENEEWLILSPDHIDYQHVSTRAAGSGVEYSGRLYFTHPLTGDRITMRLDDEQVNFSRIWQPHPHRFWEANSPTRGAVSTLDIIYHLNASIRAAARSRLVGGGIYPMPLEMTLPSATAEDEAAGISPQQKFMAEFHRNVEYAIQNPDSAAATLPFFIWGVPGEQIKNMLDKPIDFYTSFDKEVPTLLKQQLERYATGQPVPSEMVTGMSKANHWTGWQLSEEDLKYDIQPLATLALADLAYRFVRPMLAATRLGPMGAKDYCLYGDFSELTQRPNRVPEAIELKRERIITTEEARVMSNLPPRPDADDPENPDSMSDGSGGDPLRVQSVRENPPDRSLAPGGDFAAADVIARDLLATVGGWLVGHSGRGNRDAVLAVPLLERHTKFRCDPDGWRYAVDKASEKFGVDHHQALHSVSAHVWDLVARQQAYDSAELKRRLVANGR